MKKCMYLWLSVKVIVSEMSLNFLRRVLRRGRRF